MKKKHVKSILLSLLDIGPRLGPGERQYGGRGEQLCLRRGRVQRGPQRGGEGGRFQELLASRPAGSTGHTFR